MWRCYTAKFEEQRPRRVMPLVIAAIAFIIFLLGGVFIGLFLNGFLSATAPTPTGLTSFDWGGYVAVSNFANPRNVVTAINGSWYVPTVAATLADTYSAAWIGIGGFDDSTLIQTGTEQDSIGGQTFYSAWYELLPNDSVTIDSINVSPGDLMSASISLIDSASNTWRITITGNTSRTAFSQDFAYGSSQLSAEWIVERPMVNNSTAALAMFSSITFTNAAATVNGSSGPIGQLTCTSIVMYDRHNDQLVTVSSLSSDGTSFGVSYGVT